MRKTTNHTWYDIVYKLKLKDACNGTCRIHVTHLVDVLLFSFPSSQGLPSASLKGSTGPPEDHWLYVRPSQIFQPRPSDLSSHFWPMSRLLFLLFLVPDAPLPCLVATPALLSFLAPITRLLSQLAALVPLILDILATLVDELLWPCCPCDGHCLLPLMLLFL